MNDQAEKDLRKLSRGEKVIIIFMICFGSGMILVPIAIAIFHRRP